MPPYNVVLLSGSASCRRVYVCCLCLAVNRCNATLFVRISSIAYDTRWMWFAQGWRWLQVKILSGCTAKLIPCEASLPGIWVWQLYCHQDHLVFLPLTLQAVKHSAGSIAFRYPHSLFNYIACHHCSTLLYNFFSQCAKWNCDPHHMFMRAVWAAFECSWDERIWLNVALPGIHGSFICNSGLLVLKFWIEVAFSDGCFIIIWLNWLPVSYDIHI